MISPSPIQAVAKLIDGHKENGRARERNKVVDAVQIYSRVHVVRSSILSPLADVAPMKIVDERRGNQGGETDSDALAVVQDRRCRSLSGKLPGSRLLVVLRLAACE